MARSSSYTSAKLPGIGTFGKPEALKRTARDDEIKQTILKMWLRCYTQDEIAETVSLTRQRVEQLIAENANSTQMRETGIFGNFTPQLYTIWNFPKIEESRICVEFRKSAYCRKSEFRAFA